MRYGDNAILNEGVNYSNDLENTLFTINFETESKENLLISFKELNEPVKLNNQLINANEIFYLGFDFISTITSTIRAKFFHALRFNQKVFTSDELKKFAGIGLNILLRDYSLYNFETICVPKSRSPLNKYLVSLFSKTVGGYFEIIEFVKEIPQNIQFDWNRFTREELDSTIIMGNKERPRYTDTQKASQIQKIKVMLDDIHNSEYFSIASSVTKNKYKKYFIKYLTIDENNDLAAIRDTKKPILIIDDVTTTGTTLFECIKTIRFINQTIPIIIFTLIGKKELINYGK